MKSFFLFLLTILVLGSCAKRGNPTGGPIDESPPEVIKTEPENNSVFFNDNRIRIFFNEYIKLEKLNSQLVVSPPIEKNKYSIFPQGGASKYIDIEINEIFSDSTTYVFNFGQSIIDNNENNELPFYKYAFSTGSYIDSLELDGMIYDSFSAKTDKLITAMLYPYNNKFYDSIIYKEKPTYVASTLDSTYFNFTNVKAGKYQLIAIKDNNNNYLFDPLIDKIAFYENIVDLPNEEEKIELNIFKENPDFFIFKPFQNKYNRLSFGFRGNTENLKINIQNERSKPMTDITFEKETDTLNFWFNEFDYDTLYLKVINNSYNEKFKIPFPKKEIEKDSLEINSENKNYVDLGSKFILNSNIPLKKINNELIKIIDKDSSEVNFITNIKEKMDIEFDFEILPNDKYSLMILPNAIVDFYENTNDTLNYSFDTKDRSNYGQLILSIKSINEYPLIVDLLDSNEKVIKSNYLLNDQEACIFENITPGDYNIRLIYDKNQNQKWDTGNYLKKINPERTIHNLEKIKIRANWIIRENI